PPQVQGELAALDPLSKPRVADVGEFPPRHMEQFEVGGSKFRYAEVPDWPPVVHVDSLVPGVDAEDRRPVDGETPQARPLRLEGEAAVVLDRVALVLVHGVTSHSGSNSRINKPRLVTRSQRCHPAIRKQ